MFLTGGELKGSTEALIGTEAVGALQRYHFVKGFFGVNGITLKCGFTTPDIHEASVKESSGWHSAVNATYWQFRKNSPCQSGDLCAVLRCKNYNGQHSNGICGV